jgi:cytochrome c5
LIARAHILIVALTLLLTSLVLFAQWSLAENAAHDGEPIDTQGVQIDGEKVFEQACFSCHGTGFYGAPLIGDPYDWQERLARGETELIANTLRGLNSMPAKGGCAACSDAEIQAAVRYLINY